MRRCARCGRPIEPGDTYNETIPDSTSAARPTVYVHDWECNRPRTLVIPHTR